MRKKRLIILGAGESGVGAAALALQLGYEVFVSDKSPIKAVFRQALEKMGIPFEEGQHNEARILGAHLVVKSPGIPDSVPILQTLRQNQIPVIGEIEFAYRHAGKCRIVGITGTNGKTTTTKLTNHLLQHAGLKSRMAGNVGHSFATLIAQDMSTGNIADPERIFVLEVSSFQLDDVVRFRPNIGILLNITPDHLDRYGYVMANYVRSKFRIAMNQRRGDLLILNKDDLHTRDYLAENPDSVHCKVKYVGHTDFHQTYVKVGRSLAFDLGSSALKGPHNMFNAACAIRTALTLGADPTLITEALYSFAPPPHRLEKIAVINGVTYINDSKATNTESVFYALQAMTEPIVWIAGGQDKGNDYRPLVPLIDRIAKAIVCLGADNSRIKEAFGHLGKPIWETQTAEDAVRLSASLAAPGETVLLSPACASFDLFHNYEHRGEMFREAVLQMKKNAKNK